MIWLSSGSGDWQEQEPPSGRESKQMRGSGVWGQRPSSFILNMATGPSMTSTLDKVDGKN